MINLFEPTIFKDTIEAVNDVLRSRFIGQGPKVDQFEKEFEKFFNVKYAVAVNSGTSALETAYDLVGLEKGDEVITTPLTCLSYWSPVLLADKTTMRIGILVNKRIKTKVLSLNRSSGILEPKEIIGWTKLPAKKINWYRIYLKNKIKSHGLYGQCGLWITGDHKILTKNGYLRVDELSNSEFVATRQKQLNPKQLEVIIGMLLGDGHLRTERKGYSRFGIIHCERQKELFDLEIKALSGFEINIHRREAYKRSSPAFSCTTRGGNQWMILREQWYPKGKKIVPENIILTPLTLATFYMDDGSYEKNAAILCIGGFNRDSVWKIFWKLAELDLKPRIESFKDQLRIHIGNGNGKKHNSANKFFDIISPYIPPSMRYKIPPNSKKYDPNLWNLGNAEISYEKIIVEKGKIPPRWHKPKFVYCIEIKDNHNFISGDIVLSNCTATNLPLVRRNIKIIFADILEDTLCIDPVDVRSKITDKTKAVVQTHLGGVRSDIGKLHIPVISDAAQALGIFKGDITCNSFQAIKMISTPDLGMVTINNLEEAHKAKLLRWFGINRERKILNQWQCYKERKMIFDIELAGCKRQPNDLAAAMALVGLKHYHEILNHRRKIFNTYKKELANVDGIKLIDGKENVYWLCTLLVERRDEFSKMMFEADCDTNIVQVRNDIYKIFGGERQDLPIMNKVEEKYLSIPCGMNVSEEDARYICEKIKGGW